jgi:hypothetical protein
VQLPKRWIVERTIAWLNRCRRLAKDWENLNRNALAFLKLASVRLMSCCESFVILEKVLRRTLTKKQRSKIERTIEYYHELSACIEAECEKNVPEFSQAMVQVEAAVRDLAEIYDGLAKVPRFEHR